MGIIEITNLHKEYKSSTGNVKAVNGVNLSVKKNLIYGFLGPNGAGKTTTLRIISTLMKPDSGKILIAGIDVTKNPVNVRKIIGYVGQKTGCIGGATAEENILLYARLHGLSKKEARYQAQRLIKLFELDSFSKRKTSTLSGGQLRRVDLAMGIVHSPQLLFLDEPTSGLDPQSRAYLWDELRKLHAEGLTIFMSTHYLNEADAVCDRVAIIDHGGIVAEDTPLELKRQVSGDVLTLMIEEDDAAIEEKISHFKNNPFVTKIHYQDNVLKAYLQPDKAALTNLLETISLAKLNVRTLNLTQPSLDEVFLIKTGRSLRDN